MRQIQVFLRLKEKKINAHNRDNPRKAGKYVQRWSAELEPRWYFRNVYNESSKKEFQRNWYYKPRWCDFILKAAILHEAISRTIVLMILRSVCTSDLNFSQQLDATYLTPKLQATFKSLATSLPRDIARKSRWNSTRFSRTIFKLQIKRDKNWWDKDWNSNVTLIHPVGGESIGFLLRTVNAL